MQEKLKDKYIDPFTDFGFKKLFGEEYQAYIDSLNSYRDLKNCMDTAEEEGRVKGKAEGEISKTIEIVKNAKVLGLSIEQIQKLTNLTKEKIEEIN